MSWFNSTSTTTKDSDVELSSDASDTDEKADNKGGFQGLKTAGSSSSSEEESTFASIQKKIAAGKDRSRKRQEEREERAAGRPTETYVGHKIGLCCKCCQSDDTAFMAKVGAGVCCILVLVAAAVTVIVLWKLKFLL